MYSSSSFILNHCCFGSQLRNEHPCASLLTASLSSLSQKMFRANQVELNTWRQKFALGLPNIVIAGKGSERRKSLHRKSKKEHRKSKITSKIRTSKVSIKRIRTSKDQNDDNYLWRSTYGYQGLCGVRLGTVWLGLVMIG